jgi:hypothetical protein
MPTSPAINRGNNTHYVGGATPDLSSITTDFDGSLRTQHGIVDLGAYESSVALEMTRYVIAGGTGNGSSWTNASDDLQKMMDDLATLGGGVVKLGAGTHKPQWMPMIPNVGNPYVRAAPVSPATSRDAAFILRPGVEVRGGYDSSTGNRDITLHVTTLSGEIGSPGPNDNAYHVVLGLNIPAGSGTVLDGLTINFGNADGTGTGPIVAISQRYGGGIYNENSSPVLTNVTITGNSSANGGGGMYNNDASSPVLTNVTISNSGGSGSGSMYNNNSSPVLTNVTISGSTIGGGGGGIYNNANSSPVLTNVSISSNSAGGNGGGIYNDASSPVLINVLISGNESGTTAAFGGGMYNANGSSPRLTNVTIAGNRANGIGGGGGGIYNNDGSSNPQIRNSIIWGNADVADTDGIKGSGTPTVDYSAVEGWTGGGTDNVSTPAPAFEGPVAVITAPTTTGDYRLVTSSSGINQGNSAYYYDDITYFLAQYPPSLSESDAVRTLVNAALLEDLDGSTRKQGTRIDMGAYEKP